MTSKTCGSGWAMTHTRSGTMNRVILGVLLLACLSTAGWAQQPPPTRPPVGVESGPASWAAGPYQYDGAGNIKSIGSPWGTQNFTYDTVGRLVSAHVTSPGLASDQSYWYDAFGNLTQKERDTNHINIGVSSATN